MREQDRDNLAYMLNQSRLWNCGILCGQVNHKTPVRSLTWDQRRVSMMKPNMVSSHTQHDISQVFPTDHRRTFFFLSAIPHNSTYVQTWLELALALGYLDDAEDIVILPPGASDYFELEELESRGIKIIYMEKGREVLRNITNGDILFSNRLSSRNIPEYKLVFSGKLPLNVKKLLERNSRRIIADKLKYAFRTKFTGNTLGQRTPEEQSWDVFQHARAISLGHFTIDKADDLVPESQWERNILDLLATTDINNHQVELIESRLKAIVSELETYEQFWIDALEGAPVAPIQYRFQDSNREEVEKWAEILGVKSRIDAYVQGIAAEDVIGGEIEHKKTTVRIRL